MSTIPTIDLNDGARIPQLGFGVFQIEPDKTARSVKTALEIGYRHIDTAEMYQNEAGVGQGIRDNGLDRAEVYITSKLNNGFHKPDDARRAFDATLAEARLRLCRPVPHPLAAADALRWRLRLDLADARGVQEGRARPQHRGVQLPGRPLAAAGTRNRHHTSGEPDRGTPVLDQRRGARLWRRARDRHRGVVAHRPGAGARRSGRQANRRGCRPDTGSGRAALAHPARRHRVPEIGDSATHQRKLRTV